MERERLKKIDIEKEKEEKQKTILLKEREEIIK